MLGAIIKGISVLKHIGKIVPVVKAVVDTRDKWEPLLTSFKRKMDTDGDGEMDLTKKEAIELVAEIVIVIVRSL